MAAILDFLMARQADLLSRPLGTTMPNLVLVSHFAQNFYYLPHYRDMPQYITEIALVCLVT